MSSPMATPGPEPALPLLGVRTGPLLLLATLWGLSLAADLSKAEHFFRYFKGHRAFPFSVMFFLLAYRHALCAPLATLTIQHHPPAPGTSQGSQSLLVPRVPHDDRRGLLWPPGWVRCLACEDSHQCVGAQVCPALHPRFPGVAQVVLGWVQWLREEAQVRLGSLPRCPSLMWSMGCDGRQGVRSRPGAEPLRVQALTSPCSGDTSDQGAHCPPQTGALPGLQEASLTTMGGVGGSDVGVSPAQESMMTPPVCHFCFPSGPSGRLYFTS